MAFCLRSDAPIAAEVRRLVRKQLRLGAAALQAGVHDEAAIHVGRRHIKKARAICHLIAGGGQSAPARSDRRLRRVARQLGPIADAGAVLDTLQRMRRAYGAELPRHTFLLLLRILQRRRRRIAQRTRRRRVLQDAARQLRAEERAIGEWTFPRKGFAAIAPGLRRSVRRARKAMAAAAAHPCSDHLHAWRRRAKDQWFQLRLVDGRCGGQLRADRQRLEALDGCLGEYHNAAVLLRILMSERPDSRNETAQFLRLVRRYQRELRHQSLILGAAVHDESPRTFVRRVRRLWHARTAAATPAQDTVSTGARPWPRTA